MPISCPSLVERRGSIIAMGFGSYPLGQNARELVRMTYGGLTPMEAIVAAPSNAAAALGLRDVGVVDSGAGADLLVLDGDPFSEPAILLDANSINLIQGGEISQVAPHRRSNSGRTSWTSH